jgi:homocysteine S-methyltransferase
MHSFHTALQNKTLLGDGAMGTLLMARGANLSQCLEALVVEQPELVKAIHLEYARAGAEILTTHTFGANRLRLTQHGMEGQVATLNAAAVELVQQARQKSGRNLWIAGNVGPSGSPVAWHDPAARKQVGDAFREQITALVTAGVDLLLFETFSDVEELALAVECARGLCCLPIVASMSYGADALTLAGQDAATVTEQLMAAGVDVVGANCSVGPEQMVSTLAEMAAAAPQALFSVSPNAGLPQQREDGQWLYPLQSEAFAAYVPRFVSQGAAIIAGCCGTTPATIAAMRQRLDQLQPHESNAVPFSS